MDDLHAVLKVEVNSSEKYTLSDLFSHLAEEPQIELFPFISDNAESSHYYLRFSSPIFAEYALNHKAVLDDVSVFPVNRNPNSVNQYQQARSKCLASLPSSGQQNAFVYSALSPEKPAPFSPGHKATLDSALAPTKPRLLNLSPGFDRGSCNIDSQGSSTHGFPPKEANATPRTPTRAAKCLDTDAESPDVASFQKEILGISCEAQINLNICGETTTLDLDSVCSEPKVIIELLKATKSERGNYWVVAAFYRRKKDPQSARQVLLSMIEEFTQQGVSEQGLQTAYLLLSGCELDLARQAKNDKKEASVISAHYSSAQKWLQKVFGKGREKCNVRSERIEMEEEIGSLRRLVAKQVREISELKRAKRKLEEDVWYEREKRRRER